MTLSTDASAETDALREEHAHLQETLVKLDRQLAHLQSIPKYFESDRDEPQTADEVAQQTVDRIRADQIEALTAALREPYFGRIDFTELGEKGTMALYIGKRGAEDEQSGDRLVIDWRAPIASIFYSFSGKGDEASYESPDGTIEGHVSLKRNIVIRHRELQRVVDSYVKGQENLGVTDEFLLYRLTEHKDNRLRDIVSTIQAEQDKIIRTDRDKAMVIQGVAGSGKTTVALHRLAYLLYQYGERLRPDRMVIFAPNAMFVDYISDVLPELGVGNIRQTTFVQWALQVLENTVKVRDAATRLSRWFGVEQDAKLADEFRVTQFKGSHELKEALDRKLHTLESEIQPPGDFIPWEGAHLQEDEITTWFQNDYSHYPLAKRRERVLARIKRWYEMEYRRVKGLDRSGSVKKQAASRFRSYASKWPSLSVVDVYVDVLAETLPSLPWLTQSIADGGGINRKARRPEVDGEDLAPLVYLHLRLNGVDGAATFDHVVIDEAQDFSPLQMMVLQSYCPSQSFTILGDLSQSIHTYQGITDWAAFLDLFPEEKRAYFQLDVSYRSTMEVIDFANSIIRRFGEFSLAKPVFRSGDPVVVRKVDQRQRYAQAVAAVQKLTTEADSVAVVCRTEADAVRYHRAFEAAGVEAHLITAREQRYQGGISVLPVYLTKGLEFDAVLIVDADEENYESTPLAAKLLYVGCTRALHTLWVFHAKPITPLLDDTESRGALA